MSAIPYEDLLNEAKGLYASANDDRYIALHFAEQGVDDPTIDKLLQDIQVLRKSERKAKGRKMLIAGALTTLVGIAIAYWANSLDAAWSFFLFGLPLIGVGMFAKGVVDQL